MTHIIVRLSVKIGGISRFHPSFIFCSGNRHSGTTIGAKTRHVEKFR